MKNRTVNYILIGLGIFSFITIFPEDKSIWWFSLLLIGLGAYGLIKHKKTTKEQGEDISNIATVLKDSKDTLQTYYFRVAGTHYHQVELAGMVKQENEFITTDEKWDGYTNKEIKEHTYDYQEETRFYEFPILELFEEVKLIPEPTNEYDKNAIKVVIKDILIGYVPSDEAEAVKKVMGKMSGLNASIVGGRYKYYDVVDETIVTNQSDYNVNININYDK